MDSRGQISDKPASGSDQGGVELRERKRAGVELWSLVLRTHAALLPRLEQDLHRQRQLPLAWYDVLLELNAAPDRRLRMQELGNRVVLSRSRASRVVDELEREGLVRRDADPSDRRGSYAVMTDAGRTAFRSAAPVYLAGIFESFTRHLDPQEVATMSAALSRVLAAQAGEAGAGGG